MAKSDWQFIDDFPDIERRLTHELSGAVVRTGNKALVKAKKDAPKDTTALSKSGAMRGEGVDTESEAKTEAEAANPELQWDSFTNITSTPGILSVEIGFGADYAVPVHSGHMAGNTFVAPRPFLSNALNSSEETLEEEGNKALERTFKGAKT